MPVERSFHQVHCRTRWIVKPHIDAESASGAPLLRQGLKAATHCRPGRIKVGLGPTMLAATSEAASELAGRPRTTASRDDGCQTLDLLPLRVVTARLRVWGR